MLNQLFKKTKYIRLPMTSGKNIANVNSGNPIVDLPLVKCKGCQSMVFLKDLKKNHQVCPKCGYHFTFAVRDRIAHLTDGDSFIEMDEKLSSANPLEFPEYATKKLEAQLKTNEQEAVVTGIGTINQVPVGLGVMSSAYMMGSMGSGVGEKLTRLIELCTEKQLPLIIVSASGGARMQEGIFSLMQMAKTSAALHRFSEAGGFYLVLLTHPTTGGVTASFAMLGDVILAEPGALIGFAGPRVIEQTIRQKLPEGFQTAEFLEAHGMVDSVVSRREQKEMIGRLLKWHSKETTFAHPKGE